MDVYRLSKNTILVAARDAEGIKARRFDLGNLPADLEAATLAEPEDLAIIFAGPEQDGPLTVREPVRLDSDEVAGGLTARQFFAASPAAVEFVRLSPAEQAAQIDGMTLAQVKAVVKYLAVAVSALIKREFL